MTSTSLDGPAPGSRRGAPPFEHPARLPAGLAGWVRAADAPGPPDGDRATPTPVDLVEAHLTLRNYDAACAGIASLEDDLRPTDPPHVGALLSGWLAAVTFEFAEHLAAIDSALSAEVTERCRDHAYAAVARGRAADSGEAVRLGTLWAAAAEATAARPERAEALLAGWATVTPLEHAVRLLTRLRVALVRGDAAAADALLAGLRAQPAAQASTWLGEVARRHEAARAGERGDHATAARLWQDLFAEERRRWTASTEAWHDSAHTRARLTAAERAIARSASLLRTLRAQATTDPLTGLLNRRGLDTALRTAFGEREMGLVVFDIDRFKEINDTHAHAVGDAVLRRLGALARATVRQRDLAARLGGDEFLVVASPPVGAPALAGRLRQAVADAPWPAIAPGLTVTLSMGVMVGVAPADFERALARADEALYVAKRTGRDRIVIVADGHDAHRPHG